MHDIVDLEGRGIPGVFVATEAFVDAAGVQSAALGMPGVRRVFVPHPVSNQTDDEVQALAETVVDELLGAVTRRGKP